MNSLLNLPDVVLEHVFSYLSYDAIAQNRIVCRKFNETGSKMLNRGYYAADRFHAKTLKTIKAKLPRRESERRVHPLDRHCDILTAIATRLSMLAMTFTKWMDAKVCCFIPGKVIDEIMKVLRCVANNPNPPRSYEILQELRDTSSMAMEHFDEKILPRLKMMIGMPPFFQGSSRSEEEIGDMVLKPRVCIIPPHISNTYVTISEFNRLGIRESLTRRKVKAQSLLLAKQAREMSKLRKQMEEWEAKVRDLTAKLIKAKELPPPSSTPSTSSNLVSPSNPPIGIVRCNRRRKATQVLSTGRKCPNIRSKKSKTQADAELPS